LDSALQRVSDNSEYWSPSGARSGTAIRFVKCRFTAEVLRGFDRLYLEAGQSETFTAQLLRRDVSVWDIVLQNWVLAGDGTGVKVWVGRSSRDLPLEEQIIFDG
jgi:Fibronectin type III-like domain